MKPVNPKENQLWIFTGRTDAEAESPILWPPDVKSWLIEKGPDAGKDWRLEEKGAAEDETDSITDSMDVNLSKVQERVKDEEAWHAVVHGVTKSRTWLSDWTTTIKTKQKCISSLIGAGKEPTGRLQSQSPERTGVQLWGCREQDQTGGQTSTGMSHLQLPLFLGYSSHTQLPRGQCLNDLIWSHAPGGTGTLGDSPSLITGFNRRRGWLPQGKSGVLLLAEAGLDFGRTKSINAQYSQKTAEHTAFGLCLCLLVKVT